MPGPWILLRNHMHGRSSVQWAIHLRLGCELYFNMTDSLSAYGFRRKVVLIPLYWFGGILVYTLMFYLTMGFLLRHQNFEPAWRSLIKLTSVVLKKSRLLSRTES